MYRSSLLFCQSVRAGKVEPDVQRTTPLCMCQYPKLFGTTRIPLPRKDKTVFCSDSTHMVGCVTWLIHVWHDSSMYDMTWGDWSICDMTHWCVTWLIHMWHDSLMCDMTWYDMTHPCVIWQNCLLLRLDACGRLYGVTDPCVTWHMHMWHDLMWLDSFMCDMTHPCVHVKTVFCSDSTHS